MKTITQIDKLHLQRAIELAIEAEKEGNMPIGAVISLDHTIIAEGKNALLIPIYDPGKHAEIEAISRVPKELWPHAGQMTCYSTLEPCMMCMGSILLHGIGRVVFGALDSLGGAGYLLQHLPEYYKDANVPAWIGPLLPEVCDKLYLRAKRRFDILPCGKHGKNC